VVVEDIENKLPHTGGIMLERHRYCKGQFSYEERGVEPVSPEPRRVLEDNDINNFVRRLIKTDKPFYNELGRSLNTLSSRLDDVISQSSFSRYVSPPQLPHNGPRVAGHERQRAFQAGRDVSNARLGSNQVIIDLQVRLHGGISTRSPPPKFQKLRHHR